MVLGLFPLGEFQFPGVTFALVAHTALQVEQTTAIFYSLFHCFRCFSYEDIPLSSLSPVPMATSRPYDRIDSLSQSPSPPRYLWTHWKTKQALASLQNPSVTPLALAIMNIFTSLLICHAHHQAAISNRTGLRLSIAVLQLSLPSSFAASPVCITA